MIEHQVLFCPFCGECFEGRTTCPAHELALVPYDRAPAASDADADDADDAHDAAHDGADDARVLALLEPGLGRAQVALAALLLAGSLPLGLAHVGAHMLRTYELAGRFPSLWTWPMVSFCALYLLARRRTAAGLRGLRVVVAWLGLVALLTLGIAAARLGLTMAEGPASYVVLVAAVLLLSASARLGVAPRRRGTGSR